LPRFQRERRGEPLRPVGERKSVPAAVAMSSGPGGCQNRGEPSAGPLQTFRGPSGIRKSRLGYVKAVWAIAHRSAKSSITCCTKGRASSSSAKPEIHGPSNARSTITSKLFIGWVIRFPRLPNLPSLPGGDFQRSERRRLSILFLSSLLAQIF
jgi:hypothetical protein